MAATNFHEQFRREDGPSRASPRGFGFLVATLAGAGALWWFAARGEAVWWLIGVTVLVAALAAFRPRLLEPAFRAWMLLGRAMHAVASPIVLGLVYFGVVTPFGLARRLFRSDPLDRRARADLSTYLVDHDPGSGDMTKQY